MTESHSDHGIAKARPISSAWHTTLVSFGSIGATFLLFMLLPLINKFAEGEKPDTKIDPIETSDFAEEEEIVEEEEPEPEEEQEEEPPPEMVEEPQELSLAELELAMNPSGALGDGLGGDIAIDLGRALGAGGSDIDALFSAADLDNKPQVLNKTQPTLTAREKKATPGRATVIFIVDPRGRVTSPRVTQSTHPDLGKAALRTIKKWRFEPGTSGGKPVQFRMRQSITFPKQR